jgi:hypothetical protein
MNTHHALLNMRSLIAGCSPQLLEVSFQYIKLPELRAIPLAVLGELNPVPAARLKQISEDAELFESLPSSVQHQVQLDHNKQAYAGQLNSFIHLRVLLVFHDRGIFWLTELRVPVR